MWGALEMTRQVVHILAGEQKQTVKERFRHCPSPRVQNKQVLYLIWTSITGCCNPPPTVSFLPWEWV